MIALLASAPDLPLGKAGKFVAAAYIVFLLIIFIYVAIMAIRAQHVERDLDQLRRDVEAVQAQREADAAGPTDGAPTPARAPERSSSLL